MGSKVVMFKSRKSEPNLLIFGEPTCSECAGKFPERQLTKIPMRNDESFRCVDCGRDVPAAEEPAMKPKTRSKGRKAS